MSWQLPPLTAWQKIGLVPYAVSRTRASLLSPRITRSFTLTEFLCSVPSVSLIEFFVTIQIRGSRRRRINNESIFHTMMDTETVSRINCFEYLHCTSMQTVYEYWHEPGKFIVVYADICQ